MNAIKTVNTLPVPTWNHLGVNGAAVPDFPKGQSSNAIEFHGDYTSSVIKNVEIAAVGDDALEQYITENKNAQLSLSISKDVKTDLHIGATITAEKPLLCESLSVVVESDVAAKMFHVITSDKKTNGHYASLIKIRAEKNARLHLTLVQLFDETVQDWSQLVIEAEEGAVVDVVRVLLGSCRSVQGVKTLLLGDDSSYTLNTYYHAKDDEVIDINDISIHIGKNTVSDMYLGGILDDNSSKIYRGTIDFRKGAQKADGKEIDDVLLMSPTVHNKTCPLILCGEESVAGEHAATIGRFNDEQLFYLCSRGLTVSQAKRLLIDAKLHNVVSKIQDEELQIKVLEFAR